MGANAQRRREAKASRAKFRQQFGTVDSATFNRMARKTCSECGSGNPEWKSLDEFEAGPEPHRAHAREAKAFLLDGGEGWACLECGGFGAFESELQIG